MRYGQWINNTQGTNTLPEGLAGGDLVEVELRNGRSNSQTARRYRWDIGTNMDDIIRYRKVYEGNIVFLR